MKTERRHSYGIIPVYKSESGYEVLVVRQHQLGVTYWSFAKGTPEEGETPLETAIRETREEVGITFSDIDETVRFSETYSFEEDGRHIEKTTTYFFGVVQTRDFVLQEEEISAAKWVQLHEVEAAVTFPETKKIVRNLRDFSQEYQA